MIGTKIYLEDRSAIPSLGIAEHIVSPIIMAAFTSDRGTEDYTMISGKDFANQYGEISFKRHGQPLLQADYAIRSGATLYAKRVVADDAVLAGFGVYCTINTEEKTYTRVKTNADGTPKWKDESDHSQGYDTEDLYWCVEESVQSGHEATYIEDERSRRLKTKDEWDADSTGTANTEPAKYHVAKINYMVDYDSEGKEEKPLGEGEGTIVVGNDIHAYAKWFRSKICGIKSDKPLPKASDSEFTSSTKIPLFVITDNGRGKSRKKISIQPEDLLGRNSQSARFILRVLEDNVELESLVFSLNPDELQNGYNLFFESVIKRNSAQIKCVGFEDGFNLLFEKIKEVTGLPISEIRRSDILDGVSYKGDNIPEIQVDTTPGQKKSVQLTRIEGFDLIGGTYGTLGEAPITELAGKTPDELDKTQYALVMEKAFNGKYSDEIYNYDNIPIDVVIDANYPPRVKKAIAYLAEWRQDVFFFRDMGLGLTTFESIKNYMTGYQDTFSSNRSVGTYCQSYDIYDPYTKKQITVTIGYDIARLICMHWVNGRNLVLAGQSNGWVINDIIPGTLSFTPKKTPYLDQTNLLDDLRINYGQYYNNIFSLVSEYTSQDLYTQLSFINNMLSIQGLIKDIRVQCPKSRYRFITGQDFEKYKSDVQDVIDRHKHGFKSITIEFEQNAIYAANKIVYAVIKVTFKDFDQAEIFRIIALPIEV